MLAGERGNVCLEAGQLVVLELAELQILDMVPEAEAATSVEGEVVIPWEAADQVIAIAFIVRLRFTLMLQLPQQG